MAQVANDFPNFQLSLQATGRRYARVRREVFLEADKVDKQTKYTIGKRIPYILFLDQKRLERGVCTIRHINGDEKEVPLDKLAEDLR